MIATTTKQLKYDFSEPEQFQNAKALARELHALEEAEQKRKQIVADLKAEEARTQANITRLSRWVNDGYDYRATDCRVIFNDPEDGKKSIYRLDNKELVETLPMEEHEKQSALDLGQPGGGEEPRDPEEGDFDGTRPAY